MVRVRAERASTNSTLPQSYDELNALTSIALRERVSNAELMELAIALGVTTSPAIFWRSNRTTEDLIGALFDHRVKRNEVARREESEAEAAHITLLNARASIVATCGTNSLAAVKVDLNATLIKKQALQPYVHAAKSGGISDQTETIVQRSRHGSVR